MDGTDRDRGEKILQIHGDDHVLARMQLRAGDAGTPAPETVRAVMDRDRVQDLAQDFALEAFQYLLRRLDQPGRSGPLRNPRLDVMPCRFRRRRGAVSLDIGEPVEMAQGQIQPMRQVRRVRQFWNAQILKSRGGGENWCGQEIPIEKWFFAMIQAQPAKGARVQDQAGNSIGRWRVGGRRRLQDIGDQFLRPFPRPGRANRLEHRFFHDPRRPVGGDQDFRQMPGRPFFPAHWSPSRQKDNCGRALQPVLSRMTIFRRSLTAVMHSNGRVMSVPRGNPGESRPSCDASPGLA